MAEFRCKACGALLKFNTNDTVVLCQFCGETYALRSVDDKRTQLYYKATCLCCEYEFDKAMEIYKKILAEDEEDCEAYWGIVLCRYGVQYITDTKSNEKTPIVTRTQFTSIYEDEAFCNAIKYSDEKRREIFKKNAELIEEIRKKYIEIASKQEPFDVFICCKEVDKNGNRTHDSVYAQDIYTSLTKEGHKVFFARITLADKLGNAYGPYIFAALNSAKVMIVVGTEKANFNATSVKSVWSRFISLMKSDGDKRIIPVYKDMSLYEIPKPLAYYQSTDIGKIGSFQELIYDIGKIVGTKVNITPHSGAKDYIFISYAHKDKSLVLPIIQKLYEAGYRVWYDEGINPGTEWDDFIAERLENSGYFIAFISEAYLRSDNCKDELKYARDLEKGCLLIYLSDVKLTGGLAMRLNRLQAIHKYKYPSLEAFIGKLKTTPEIDNFKD